MSTQWQECVWCWQTFYSSSSLRAQLDILRGGQGEYCSSKLLLTISLPAGLIYSPPSSTMPCPTSHPSPSVPLFYCSHALFLPAFSVFTSISLFSMVGCESASSTLQWRQIRPSQLCHHKTSFRKVATSSPFQLICRHSESGEEECLPCSSITSPSPLS